MESKKSSTPITVALITSIGLIIVALIQFQPWQKAAKKSSNNSRNEFLISGTVIDALTNEAVRRAEISLVGRNEQYYTENNGNFRILFKDSAETIRLRVKKAHFNVFDKSYNVPQQNIIIQLESTK